VRYEGGKPVAIERVVVSTQHVADAAQADIKAYVIEDLAPRVLGDWCPKADLFLVNPSGSFSHGGPSADAGVTGRKIIVDRTRRRWIAVRRTSAATWRGKW